MLSFIATAAPVRRQETRLGTKQRRLVLASRSLRRQRLLAEHGVEHETVLSGIDDSQLHRGQATPAQWVASLAYLKAAAGADALGRTGPALVIGADTVCVKDGDLLGQPRDGEDAARMLRLLERGSHDVLTGVALLWVEVDGSHRREVLVDRAHVRVGEIGPERIRGYVEAGEWRGKAGAYNLSERLEAGWPIEYEGDPATIMGLPMRALMGRLKRAGAA